MRDLIYQDLKKDLGEAEKALVDARKAKEEAKTKVDAAVPRTIELKDAEREYWKAVKMIDALESGVKYLSIRVERRRVETRAAYKAAFLAQNEDNWPDKSEYSGYLAHKRLREASLNWSRRVPKLQDRIPASQKE